MARDKGRWKTNYNIDLGSVIKGLGSIQGQYIQRDVSDQAWQNSVTQRLTGVQSAWHLSENEYDDVKINANIESLKAQHDTYKLNHSKKYVPGSPAYDSVLKTIEDQEYQYQKSLNFKKDYDSILESNDFSIEQRLVPQFDDFGVETNAIMMNDWDIIQNEVINYAERDIQTGEIIYTDKTHETVDKMINGIEGIGTQVWGFKQKYNKWIQPGGDISKKLSIVGALNDEQLKKLQQVDDSIGGDFITNKPFFERLTIALETDSWDEYDAENKLDRDSRRQRKSSIQSERDKLQDVYMKSHMKMNADRYLTKTDKNFWRDPNVTEYQVSRGKNTMGEQIFDSMTKTEIISKFAKEHRDLVNEIAGYEWQLQQGWGVQRDALLMGSDRLVIDKFGQKSFSQRITDLNVETVADTTETPPNINLTTPLNKETELKNVKLGGDEISGKIDNINKLKSEIDNYTYSSIYSSSLLNVLNKKVPFDPRKAPISKKEILKLRDEFTAEGLEYKNAVDEIANIEKTGLAQWKSDSFFGGSKRTDVGLAVVELAKIKRNFEKKWGSKGEIKLGDREKSHFSHGAIIDAKSPFRQLELAVNGLQTLKDNLNKQNLDYQNVKQTVESLNK